MEQPLPDGFSLTLTRLCYGLDVMFSRGLTVLKTWLLVGLLEVIGSQGLISGVILW